MIGRRATLAALGACGVRWSGPSAAAAVAPLGRDDTALERIASLRPGHAMALGPAGVVGDLNDTARAFDLHRTGPRARDFCRKMVWAPERGRALFAGANHGHPHRLNDVWEFDLGAMRWNLLYGPDFPRTYGGLGPDSSDVVYRDGVLSTKRGGPAVIGHTWSGLTYDPVLRRMLFMNTWPIDVDALVRAQGGDPAVRDRSPPLWAFDPQQRRWEKWRTAAPWPKAAVGALLEHVPELGGSIWHLNNWQLHASWLLSGDPPRWSVLGDERQQADFRTQAPGRELVGYHDPERQRLVTQCRQDTFTFDTRTLRWSRTLSGEGPDGHDAYGTLVRDPGSGHGLLVDFKQGALWRYDVDRPAWTRLEIEGDPFPVGARQLSFAHPPLGVLVVIDAVDVWVYRPARPEPSRPGR